MTRHRSLLLSWLLGLAAVRAALAADATPVEPVVSLPPMIVSEAPGLTTWQYVKVGRDEYLSRCSSALTLRFIESRERLRSRLRTIVPDAFLADVPFLIVLTDQIAEPKAADAVAREMLHPGRSGAPFSAVRYLPSLGLDGRDVIAMFTYLTDAAFRDGELSSTEGNLRFLLERRTPMLPPWLVEGVLAIQAQIDPGEEQVTLRPFVWLTAEESRALARNPDRPRALLPAGEMFAPDALRAEGDRHPRRVQTLRAQVGLLLRWALDPRNKVREPFWKFAQLASERRATEELFTSCFGFGFSDLRDQLNDYLPLAVKEPLTLDPAAESKLAPLKLRDATRTEIGRLRGEWERLEIAHVQSLHPEFTSHYIAQARRTLRIAYEQDNRDTELMAEVGLCEVDAGEPANGLPLLESALAAGANRPRAGYEIARFRFGGLLRGQPASRMFSAEELAPVLEPLRRAVQQAPALPEVFGLLADACVRSRDPAPPADIEALVRGARLFALNPAVSYRLALALARCGRRVDAIELLAHGADYVPDDATRARYRQLEAALSAR